MINILFIYTEYQRLLHDFLSQVAGVASVVEAATGKHNEVVAKFRATVTHLHDQLRVLTERREAAQQELTRQVVISKFFYTSLFLPSVKIICSNSAVNVLNAEVWV